MIDLLNYLKSTSGISPSYKQILAGLLLAGTVLAGSAEAGTITGNINTRNAFSPTNIANDDVTYYNAPSNGPFPGSAVQIGEFDFTIPAGQAITGATISGNFGSNTWGSTAAVDLFLNGIAIASCDTNCSFNTGAADVAWSYTFKQTDLSLLASSAILTAVQQSESQIVLDPTSITLTTSTVPVPGAALLMGSGLLSLIGCSRRKSTVARA